MIHRQPHVRLMTQQPSKNRPSLFRALGDTNPPETITVNARDYRRIKIIKHDSWAATALYEPDSHPPGSKLICKFNRTQSIGPISMRWLGIRLAEREYQMYDLLRDLPGIAKGYRDIAADGEPFPTACAHEYIEGQPLCWHADLRDDFFDQLDDCLTQMHSRHVAYVDMNKPENVIVNTSGDPCLIDFQISVHWTSLLLRVPLRVLQRSDLYHSFKLRRHFRPYLVDENQSRSRIPWWIRAHRSVGVPLRSLRRKLLVMLGIRKGKGWCQSESFVEEALSGKIETNNEQQSDKPILRLFQLLRSRRYMQRFESVKPYIDQLFADLFQGVALHAEDKQLAKKRSEWVTIIRWSNY